MDQGPPSRNPRLRGGPIPPVRWTTSNRQELLQVLAHLVDGGVQHGRVAAGVERPGVGRALHRVEPAGAVAVGVEHVERRRQGRVGAEEGALEDRVELGPGLEPLERTDDLADADGAAIRRMAVVFPAPRKPPTMM